MSMYTAVSYQIVFLQQGSDLVLHRDRCPDLLRYIAGIVRNRERYVW
jgi:hypothetical protein